MAVVTETPERITTTLTDTNTTVSVALSDTSAGAYDDAFILFSYNSSDSDDQLGNHLVRSFFTGSPNEINFSRDGSTGDVVIEAYVYKLDNSQISVTQGTATMANNETIDDITISAVTLAKTWVPFSHEVVGLNPEVNFVSGRLTSTTNLRFERVGTSGNRPAVMSYFILEDTGSNWDTEAITMSLGATDSVVDDTITSVTMASTFLFGSYHSTATVSTVDPENNPGLRLFDSTTARAERGNGTSAPTITVHGWVVEMSDNSEVQRGTITLNQATTNTATIDAANSDVNTHRGTMIAGGDCTGGTDTQMIFARRSLDSTTSTRMTVTVNNFDIFIFPYEILEFEIVAAEADEGFPVALVGSL